MDRANKGAGYAECGFTAYAKAHDAPRVDSVDFLTDVLHWAHQRGEDCETIVRDALLNWREEIDGRRVSGGN